MSLLLYTFSPTSSIHAKASQKVFLEIISTRLVSAATISLRFTAVVPLSKQKTNTGEPTSISSANSTWYFCLQHQDIGPAPWGQLHPPQSLRVGDQTGLSLDIAELPWVSLQDFNLAMHNTGSKQATRLLNHLILID